MELCIDLSEAADDRYIPSKSLSPRPASLNTPILTRRQSERQVPSQSVHSIWASRAFEPDPKTPSTHPKSCAQGGTGSVHPNKYTSPQTTPSTASIPCNPLPNLTGRTDNAPIENLNALRPPYSA
ncbi:hypothetical protein VB005_00760 [Metarhizium brunneum]